MDQFRDYRDHDNFFETAGEEYLSIGQIFCCNDFIDSSILYFVIRLKVRNIGLFVFTLWETAYLYENIEPESRLPLSIWYAPA